MAHRLFLLSQPSSIVNVSIDSPCGSNKRLAEGVDQLQAVLLGRRHQRPPGVVVDEQRQVLAA